EHHRLVLAREVVLDDPAPQAVVHDAIEEAAEGAPGPRAVVVPDAGQLLLDRHAHARVEVPAELRAEHAGQVMAAAPARALGRRDVAPRAVGEGPRQPRPEAAVGGLGPLAPVGIHVLAGIAADVVALRHVAPEAVADEDRMLALRAARDEARAGDD